MFPKWIMVSGFICVIAMWIVVASIPSSALSKIMRVLRLTILVVTPIVFIMPVLLVVYLMTTIAG